ncbi:MAG: flagellar export chaperone FlgN [Nitriliruptoraceae bacterium]
MDRDHAHLAELGHRLWDEREVVTHLLYRLTVSKLLLAADERRFVADAFDEVEQAVARLRENELARDRAVRDLAERWQVDPQQLTLAELARRSPPPFDHTFSEHRDAFQRLAAEIEDLAGQNRALAANELDAVRGTIDLLTGEDRSTTATYDAHGQLDTAERVGSVLREVL